MGPFVSCLLRSGEKLTDDVDKAGERAPSQLISRFLDGSFKNFSLRGFERISPLLRWIDSGGTSTDIDLLQWLSAELTLVFGRGGDVQTGLVFIPLTTDDDETTVLGTFASDPIFPKRGAWDFTFSASLIA